MPAWSARLSSSIAPHYAVAIASSNLWPGAHTFTIGKYVGRHGKTHHGHGRVLTCSGCFTGDYAIESCVARYSRYYHSLMLLH